jgi:phage terminase small subunit
LRGNRPKPTELHRIRGTLRSHHKKRLQTEPIAHGDLATMPPPAWMSDSQQDGWRYAIAHAPRGVLKMIDAGVLATWVLAEDRQRTAALHQAMLDRDSKLRLLVNGGKNGLLESPYIGIMHRTAKLMLKAAAVLGFSPAARPRFGQRSRSFPP